MNDAVLVLAVCACLVITLKVRTLKLIPAVGAIAFGVLVSLATGLLPHESGMSIPEIKRYGHPLFWLVTNLNGPTEYILTNLAIDTAFWVLLSLVALLVLKRVATKLEITVNYRTLLWALVLSIPLGLIMCIIHELGHGIWGTLVGGKLIYIHVAYLIIYPFGIAISPHFRLGAAAVDGLIYGSFGYGLMLLGGSMTTTIAAWIIAIVLRKANLSYRSQVALKVLGLWGILDLPFYVVFPQIGLGHWIFFGGESGPEPLTGTRMMGIPDPAFYLTVILSTIGLVFFYFQPVCEKVLKETKTTLGNLKPDFGAQKTRRALLGSVVCGILVSLVTGAVENPPRASIIGATYYGYPLVWRVVMSTITSATDYRLINFVIDTIFWMIAFFLAWIFLQKIATHSPETSNHLMI